VKRKAGSRTRREPWKKEVAANLEDLQKKFWRSFFLCYLLLGIIRCAVYVYVNFLLFWLLYTENGYMSIHKYRKDIPTHSSSIARYIRLFSILILVIILVLIIFI
jgi:hypothetical protein